jgi:hypothetical protein
MVLMAPAAPRSGRRASGGGRGRCFRARPRDGNHVLDPRANAKIKGFVFVFRVGCKSWDRLNRQDIHEAILLLQLLLVVPSPLLPSRRRRLQEAQ